jgi:hypothetical protein
MAFNPVTKTFDRDLQMTERRITATPLPQVKPATVEGYAFDHTVTIVPSVLEKIIRDAVQTQMGLQVKGIKFNVSKDYDHHNSYTPTFDGVTVTLGNKL